MKKAKNLVKKALLIIMIGVVSTIGLVGCGNTPKENNEVKIEQQSKDKIIEKESKDEKESNFPQVQKEEVKENAQLKGNLKVGDVFETEDAKVTINKIRTTKDRNRYSKIKANRVIVIEYTYTNKNIDGTMYLDTYFFNAYDNDGEILEHYDVIDHKQPKEISKGKKCTAEMVFALNNKNNNITLDMNETMFGGEVLATWNLKIK
ncbi:putative membrane protein [Clostridium moniliforme]|uniref:Membrane protein n=1 Tax=Clostridium moniliforme TaxID=39489 RepID=A0ABS4F0Y0_9CLOT|nr:DUF4352 domain-containing protein [Clostridium moniliforme]MBP1889904.1 putative membrane protein [Clostridium moniliforme]